MYKIVLKKLFFLTFFVFGTSAIAQAIPQSVDPYIQSVEQAEHGMTLFQVIQSGGWVMIVLGLLSMVMISLVIFLFLRLNLSRLIPEEKTEHVIGLLLEKKYHNAKTLCDGDDNLIFNIITAGLNTARNNLEDCRDAVELEARKATTSLWTPLNYLSDIAQIAPMLGLLGTVLGMIQAFNTIAFDAAGVKPILLAGGVSKAMITSAGGLVIAIAATIFFSLLRTRVETITNTLEAKTNKIMNAFQRSQ